MSRRLRLTIVMTHPVQYYSPWFRYIEREVDELALTVVYASEPGPVQQGTGFEESFVWDVPLREGYENVVVRPARSSDRFDSLSFRGLDVPEVGAAIEATRPDAVLLSGWQSITLVRALRSCRARGVPLLYRGDTHLRGRRPGLSRPTWFLRTRWLLRRFDRYLAVGSRAREYLSSFGVPDERVYFSPHAVDNDFFARMAAPFQTAAARSQARRDLDLAGDAFVVLFVGKLEEIKRPRDLFLAAQRTRARTTVMVAGSGPLRQELTGLAASQKVTVTWRGFVNQSRLGRLYAVSDCLALPSRSESWGLVVNEAMSTGLPCVVSDGVGCSPDLVTAGETGERYPVGDVDALAAAFDVLKRERDSGTSRAEACRRKISAYTFEAASRGLVSACSSLS